MAKAQPPRLRPHTFWFTPITRSPAQKLRVRTLSAMAKTGPLSACATLIPPMKKRRMHRTSWLRMHRASSSPIALALVIRQGVRTATAALPSAWRLWQRRSAQAGWAPSFFWHSTVLMPHDTYGCPRCGVIWRSSLWLLQLDATN